MDAGRKAVFDWLDTRRDDMVSLLTELVSIPSVAGPAAEGAPFGKEVARALECASAHAEKLGLTTGTYRHMMNYADLSDKEQALALVCHLDVVPADREKWVHEPFVPVQEGNLLYGRGTLDNKGPTTAAIFAMAAVKAAGGDLPKSARILFGGCEESGQPDFRGYIKDCPLPPVVIAPDGAFPVGNSERGRVKVFGDKAFASSVAESVKAGTAINIVPGVLSAHLCGVSSNRVRKLLDAIPNIRYSMNAMGESLLLEVQGANTHAARPMNGTNAVTAFLKLMAELEPDGEFARLSRFFPHGEYEGESLGFEKDAATIAITMLRYADGRLHYEADSRVRVGFSAENVGKTVLEALGSEAAVDTLEPHFVPESSRLVQKLFTVYEDVTAQKPYTFGMDGMTYAHWLDNAVVFGGVLPGDGGQGAHSEDERYCVDTLLTAAKLYAAAILEFCGK